MAKYGIAKIARELDDTALGKAYYGNALLVALQIPCATMTDEDRGVIYRWLDGSNVATDGHRLHDIAILLRADGIESGA